MRQSVKMACLKLLALVARLACKLQDVAALSAFLRQLRIRQWAAHRDQTTSHFMAQATGFLRQSTLSFFAPTSSCNNP